MDWQVSSIFLIIIGIELLISNFQHRKVYSWREGIHTVVLSLLSGLVDLAVRSAYLVIFYVIYRYRVFSPEPNVMYWFLLFLFIDFQFYWLHRLEHFSRLFWAAHLPHHSAEHMNISVGFRASLMRPLYDFFFFLPLALLGFEPIDVFLMYSILQLWAVLQHTQLVGRLGWLEYIFVTPSHHRVHHASNTLYIDKNMGMALIIWDRMFGTFQRELPRSEYEPIRYGLATPLKDERFSTVVLQEWVNIWKDMRRPGLSRAQKWRYLFGRPGWHHDTSHLSSKRSST